MDATKIAFMDSMALSILYDDGDYSEDEINEWAILRGIKVNT